MKKNKFYCYLNRSDQWSSPSGLINLYLERGFIDFNPLCVDYENALLKPYASYFCNPPFSNIEPFVDYMIKCSKSFPCIMLLPVRMCSKWFIKLCLNGCKILFVGRLKYSDSSSCAPFDSMLILLDNSINNVSIAWNKSFNLFDDNVSYVQMSIFDFLGD